MADETGAGALFQRGDTVRLKAELLIGAAPVDMTVSGIDLDDPITPKVAITLDDGRKVKFHMPMLELVKRAEPIDEAQAAVALAKADQALADEVLEAPDTFGPGDVVHLKSGSMPMTIKEALGNGDGFAVVFHDGDTIVTTHLPAAALTRDEIMPKPKVMPEPAKPSLPEGSEWRAVPKGALISMPITDKQLGKS